MTELRKLPAFVVPLLLGGFCPQSPAAEPEEGHFDLYLADRVLYDDNLFRLPPGMVPGDESGETLRRADYANRISAGLDGRWLLGQQRVDLDLEVADNRFSRNQTFDHISGNGQALWNWRTVGSLSGQIGADYNRALASFANTRLYVRDLLTTFSYFGDVRYGIGARWAVRGGARRTEASHSAVEREFDDYRGDSVTAGIEYETPANTLIGWDYRRTEASFPRLQLLEDAPLEPGFSEDAATLRLRYALTGKTLLEGTGGYLKRDYDDPALSDFSGDIWRLSLYWQPGVKTQVIVSGWHELKAYADAESDHFRGTGASLAPVWSPTDKLKLELAFSWEEQEYLGSNLNLPDSIARRDEVGSAQLGVTYSPRSMLELGLSYRREERDSNRDTRTFDDNLGSFSLRFIF